MQFLRTVFWVVLAVVIVVFCTNNTHEAKVYLWDQLYWGPPMWAVVLAAFLAGLLPPWIVHRLTRWSLRRKLDTANRTLAEARAMNEPASPSPSPSPDIMPPGGTLIAPPPGVL
jgi:lipopolysaccharide assembly protein A